MEKLSLKEIFITIIISCMLTAYINNEINILNLSSEIKVTQIVFTFIILIFRIFIKNMPK